MTLLRGISIKIKKIQYETHKMTQVKMIHDIFIQLTKNNVLNLLKNSSNSIIIIEKKIITLSEDIKNIDKNEIDYDEEICNRALCIMDNLSYLIKNDAMFK